MNLKDFEKYLPNVYKQHSYISKNDFLEYLGYLMAKDSFEKTLEKLKNEKDLQYYIYRGLLTYFKLDKVRLETNLGCRQTIDYKKIKVVQAGGVDFNNHFRNLEDKEDGSPQFTGLENILKGLTELEINEVIKAINKFGKVKRKKIFNEKFLPLIEGKDKEHFNNYLIFKGYAN